MNYAGFWKRLGAFAIDFLLMMPLIYLVILGQSKFRYFDLYWALPGTVIGLWFSVYSMLALGIGLLNLQIPDGQYFSMEFMARNALIVGAAPSWHEVTIWLMQIWTWSEFLVILLNKKRRALHDYLAGTVVVNTLQTST